MLRIAFVLMALLTHPQLNVDGAAATAPPRTSGVHDIETRLDNGARARFTLALPDTLDDAGTHPLIVVLHYGGHPTRYYGRPLVEQLFRPALAGLAAIYLAPESTGGQWTDVANEAFVMRLLDAITAYYPVDRDRIVIAGYSMGAIGSWYLLEHYPECFSAAVPVAGLPAGTVTTAAPVYTLAAPNDEIFAFERFEALVAERRSAGQVIEFASVPAQGHYDIQGFRTALAAVAPWLEGIWNTTPSR
ncbi:MAG: alpha/beta hydrolase-fold protein [Gammaproteobacteria bacterium]